MKGVVIFTLGVAAWVPCRKANHVCKAINIEGVVPLQLASLFQGCNCFVPFPWKCFLRLLVYLSVEGLQKCLSLSLADLLGVDKDFSKGLITFVDFK